MEPPHVLGKLLHQELGGSLPHVLKGGQKASHRDKVGGSEGWEREATPLTHSSL